MSHDSLVLSWGVPPEEDKFSIYQQSSYQQLIAPRHQAELRWLKFSRNDAGICYLPLQVRSIEFGIYEAFSSYGYGGFCGDLIRLSEADVDQLAGFLAQSGICSLFVRHSPFLANQDQWPSTHLEPNRVTYESSLPNQEEYEAYLRVLPQKLRWSVNHARKAGYIIEAVSKPLSCNALEEFYQLYLERMKENKSDPFYIFNLTFFRNHFSLLGGQCRLMLVREPIVGSIVAGAMFLLDPCNGMVHYHLSAASKEGMAAQVMEHLLVTAMFKFSQEGFQRMHLGGGHRLDESDGLSRFKRKFAQKSLEFKITKLICDATLYQALRKELVLTDSSLFLIGDARG